MDLRFENENPCAKYEGNTIHPLVEKITVVEQALICGFRGKEDIEWLPATLIPCTNVLKLRRITNYE